MAQLPATSLSHHAANGTRGYDPVGSISGDFCNSFWGPGEDGVDILFARMRGAAKTTEELKNFWNERFVYVSVPLAAPSTASQSEQLSRNSMEHDLQPYQKQH